MIAQAVVDLRPLSWVSSGTSRLTDTVAVLSDDQLTEPSLLPGWTRKHLLAHLASNAEAVGRLATWARTGVPSPMYASDEQRNLAIEKGAHRPSADLRSWVADSATALAHSFQTLTDDNWRAEVTTAQGRRVAATELPWMRAREVMVHLVDLGTGIGFDDLDTLFCRALVDDVVAWRSRRADGLALQLVAEDLPAQWLVDGEGPRRVVSLPVARLAAWLSGRSGPSALPELGRWL